MIHNSMVDHLEISMTAFTLVSTVGNDHLEFGVAFLDGHPPMPALRYEALERLHRDEGN